MKALFTLLFLIGTLAEGLAQDRWKIVHNGKVRLAAVAESEKNSFTIKSDELKKTGMLALFIKETGGEQGWERTVMLMDLEDNELITAKGDLVKITNAKMLKAAAKAKTIRVFSMSLPKDPQKAALVRVRRIRLATILIK